MRLKYALLALAILPLFVGCESQWGPQTGQDPTPYRPLVKKTEYDIPVTLNEQTAAWIKFYQTRGRKHFEKHLARSSRYIPLMRQILVEDYGLPGDLVYIALIESGFSSRAYSRAAAAGYWQFIAATGRRYNLRIDRNVDERRDYVRATQAAARYLKDLYQEFGDWYLAFAGYNAGEGKIMKAIKRYGTKDFWRISEGSYLKRETKNYVPKFLAAMIIAKEPEKFGFHHIKWEDPIDYEEVIVTGTPLDLRVAAEATNTDLEEIQELNPELKIWFTPPDRKEYALRVPRYGADRLRMLLQMAPPHMRMGSKEYQVEAGDTIASLAKKNKISPEHLALANGLKTQAALQPGQVIGIPNHPPRGDHYFREHTELAVYRVREGDSLWKIANRHNVSLKQLRAWNKGRIGKYLKPGQKIYVSARSTRQRGSSANRSSSSRGARPEGTITYRVRSGDSLWSVANKHGVTTRQLKAWNQGKIGKYLIAGQKLTIHGRGSSTSVARGSGEAQIYRVRAGDTLSTIAQRYGVRTREIRDWNRGNLGKYLRIGQQLTVYPRGGGSTAAPSSRVASAPATTKSAPSSNGSYTVRSGDTLWEIAQRHNVTVSQLKAWNGNGVGRHIKPGQKIAIRSGENTTASSRPVALEQAPDAGRAIYHTIASGDTLWDIARKYGVSTNDIKRWNGIDQVRRLRPGDKIKIYVKKNGKPEEA